MGSLFSKPAPPVDGKRGQPSVRGGEHNVPAVKVLEGAQGVQITGNVTAVGGNLKNVYNMYCNTPESAATKDADDALLSKILKYLGLLNFRGIFDVNVEKRTPETGRAVIDSDWFQEWLMDLLGGIVWGTGMPGAGKTVLACIVIEYIQKNLVEKSKSQDICLLFAFCRYTEPLMVIDILFAILRQLLERHPQVLPYVKPMYERHERENTRPSEAEIVDLLRQIASSGLFRQTFYILDGLDEAASDIQVDLLEILTSLPVNFFITSRPLDSIKDLVPNARFITVIASDPDIALLVDQKIHRMPLLRKLLMNNATLKAEVVSIISSKSSGMFLLASLHLDMLKGCTNENQVRKALKGLPRGLNGMYDATMDRIKALPEHEADLAKRVLIWVTYAQRPLTVEELVLAVSVCPETFRFDDKSEPAGIDCILPLCCGLIQVDDTTNRYGRPRNVVRFVHYSTAEYLAKNLELHYPDDPHALIASTCVAFLRHYGFHDVLSQGSSDGKEIWNRSFKLGKKSTSMASYPYNYWGLHATKSGMIPAPAWAFLDDCKQYPMFYYYNDNSEYRCELPLRLSHRNSSCRVERLQSIHVATIYGILQYFERLEGCISPARVQTSAFNGMGSDGSTPLILASMTGSDDVVLFLTGIEGVDVDLANKSGQTALYIAVAKRHAGVVKAILSRRRVDVNRRSRERDRHTPLTLASYTGQCNIVQLLLEMEGIDINGRNILGQTALELAVQEGHQDIVELWLQTKNTNILGVFKKVSKTGLPGSIGRFPVIEGVPSQGTLSKSLSGAIATCLNDGTLKFDVNAKDDEGRSALAHSLHNPFFTEAAHALLQIPGIDVNSMDKDGTTILMLASLHETDDPRLVETIIKLGGTLNININAKDANGWTALAHAVSKGSAEIVKMLLRVGGVDCNCVDARGQTALMKAAEGGHYPVVDLLLVGGADCNCVDARNQTALMKAAEGGHYPVVERLLAGGAHCNCVDARNQTALMMAVMEGHYHVVALLLRVEGVDFDFVDATGQRLLSMAAANRSEDAVALLLQLEGVDYNSVDASGQTALMKAAKRGHYRIVALLLGVEGVDYNCVDYRGQTTLVKAAHRGWEEIVAMLLKLEGVDCNCVDAQGQTVLILAAQKGWMDIVTMLLKLGGININYRDNQGKTALAHAISRCRVQITEALLKVDSTNHTTIEGWSYLMLAVGSGDLEILRTVLRLAQFDINARDERGRTALAHAVMSGKGGDIMEVILEVEAVDVHCFDEQGVTLLMHACSQGELRMVDRLLEVGLGANINAMDMKGRTALFHAAEKSWPDPADIVSALLKIEGINCLLQDVTGRTPLMVATEKWHRKTAELLRQAAG